MSDSKSKSFLAKHWSNLLFFVFVLLLLIPQTRMPIQVFLQRSFSFSPSFTEESKRNQLTNYEWYLSDTENQVIDFSESKGKFVFVSFWATWCPPCVAEMPSIQEFYEAYGNEIDFYLVAKDASESVEKFMQKNEYTFPIVYEASPTLRELATNSLPTSYLISPSGELLIQKTGAADWASPSFFENVTDLLKNDSD